MGDLWCFKEKIGLRQFWKLPGLLKFVHNQIITTEFYLRETQYDWIQCKKVNKKYRNMYDGACLVSVA